MNIALIPARANSKRLPDKHIRLLNGLPLILHTILYAQKSPHIDEIILSTNDANVKDLCRSYGVRIIDRPEELAADNTPAIAVLQHALNILPKNLQPNYMLTLQATSPLRPQQLLSLAFEKMTQTGKHSLFSVSPTHKKLGAIQDNIFYPSYEVGACSQTLPSLYFENGLLYITQKKLIEKGIIFNEDSYPLIIEHPFATIDIDTEKDFLFAERMMQAAAHFTDMPL